MQRKTKPTLVPIAIAVLFMQTLFGSLPARAIENFANQSYYEGKMMKNPIVGQLALINPKLEIEYAAVPVNTAPMLAAIGNKTVNEGTPLTFTATATDLDSAVLTYSLVGAPMGASIDATTGVFTWTPTEAQGPGSYTFAVRVSDGMLTDEESITVTVNEVNTAPVLAAIGNKTVDEGSLLTFTASATDVDLPENSLTYSLLGAPTGASINAMTGVFTWTPTEAQGPGSYTFAVRVSDGTLTDSESITVTVNEVNAAPILAAIGNKTVDEESMLTFTASAMDVDLPENSLTYSLVGAPAGASINAMTGMFTWTPTEAQGPGSYTFAVRVSDGTLTDSETITVTVNEVNAAPVLASIGNKTVNEGTSLTFTATATDSDSAVLTYSLVAAPTGAIINAMTGMFTWTPTEAQGPGSYTFTVVVNDGALTDEESIIVTVNEVNTAPLLAAISNKTVDEESLLTFTASATDADLPENSLTYSLVGAPTGASINAMTGVFTWAPTEAQGPASYTFTVRVSDGALTDEESITVTVNEVNTAPVLAAIGNKTVDEGSLLTFTASATDVDLPENSLTYSLVGAPTGASIDATTGVFTWTPSTTQSLKEYTFTVKVSDGSLTDEEVITVTIKMVHGNNSTIDVPGSTGTAVNALTITLHTNGGTAIAPIDISSHTKVGDLPVPIREGYRFEGWYQDEALTKRWVEETILRENISLYAKWTAIPIEEPEPSQPPKSIVPFHDVERHWAKEMIEELTAIGIIQGFEDGTFRPNAPISRMHVAVLLTRVFSLDAVREADGFSDVPSTHPYYEAIQTLQQAGIIDGANGAFLPAEKMTRAQLAKVLVGVLDLTPEGTSSFADVASSHWSAGYIATLEREGITLGDSGYFRPNEPVTRAQFVAFLYRIMQKQ
ncbi:putative Ig domain-containing protein [Metasolibacillus fluoroglycofenilyticus]|uniref:putative Ig domain-containing protein n=1 Tax=Metasolibacillus fluoroglycofenilyticus TaxID=1239396 RepID=UPI000D37BF91|nr:putative Ig domain-containing protein [Metasolibacillus fluoroglycofenilyticus]